MAVPPIAIVSALIIAVLLMLYSVQQVPRKTEDNSASLIKEKRPLVWVHVPHKHNAREWLSFGSRSSTDLNQPYLQLVARTIIQANPECRVCFITDEALSRFSDMSLNAPEPILDKLRALALGKLIHKFGGILVPLSFICTRPLSQLISQPTFYTESGVDTSMPFFGAKRGSPITAAFVEYMERMVRTDLTADSDFHQSIAEWFKRRTDVHLLSPAEVGQVDAAGRPIGLAELFSDQDIKLSPSAYGLLVPAEAILSRTNYEWFASLSDREVLDSDTALGHLLLITLGGRLPSAPESLITRDPPSNWIGFWQDPIGSFWGLKPILIGDHTLKNTYPKY